MGLADLPAAERPRERMREWGEGALSDAELLAMLLGGGVNGSSAIDLARHVLAVFGSLPNLARAELSDLASLRGVGPARACALMAALELGRRALAPRGPRLVIHTAGDIFSYYAPRIAHLTHEVFHVMCLDARNRLLRDVRVAQGGFTSCLVMPREAFAPALRERACNVAFVHNHPSGDPSPSDEDRALALRLKKAGELLGIRAIDHLVIGEGAFVSLLPSH